MKANKLHPPQWPRRVLRWFHPAETLEEVEGDLDELYAYWYRRAGKRQATWRYVLNVVSVLPPFVKQRQPKNEYHQPSLIQPSMFRNYLTITLRTLAHNKVYSAINVIGLSIGLAAAMLIMLYTKDEVSFDQFHANNPHIYRVTSKSITPEGVESLTGNTGHFQGPKFGAGVPEIRAFVRYKGERSDIKKGTEIKSYESFVADSSFFSIFSFPLLSGNPTTALKAPKSVVISEKMAEQHFGTTDALGKTLLVKNSYGDGSEFIPYTVTGVSKNCPQNSSIKFDMLFPNVVSKEEIESNENWFNIFQNTFVVLQPNADLKKVEATMNRIYQADAKEAIKMIAEKYGDKNKVVYALQPFTDMHLSKDLPAQNGLQDSSNPMFSYILSGIALFILLIACINFVNLTVARSLKRAKEIGVRKVVGGGRGQLIMQFLGESFILCFAAFAFALALLQLVLPIFNELSNKALSFSYLFDFELVLGYIGLFIATGLLAGFYPALVLSNYSPVQTLYSRFNLSGKNYLQKGLVVLQFSLASFLIIATLTIYSQFNYLTNKDLGYNDKNVITIEKSQMSRNEAKLLKEELLKSPHIVDVAPKNGGSWGTVAKVNGETQQSFAYETVDATYFPLLQIPIIKGRNFSANFPSDSTQSILINETFAKKVGWKNPLGQVVNFWYNDDEKYTVIGVVKDHHFEPLNYEIKPQLFTMKPGNLYGKVFIKIKPGTETASLGHVEKTYKKLFPINPYEYKFMDEENIKRYEAEAKWKQIMLFGAILTIFISCIGLFGLATLSAERRTKEIGIRKVLGASVASITTLLSADFLKLVSFSFIFAFPAAYYAIKEWLQNYPYRIDISAWTFAIAAALSILIAFFTVSFQSIRAALGNPVKSLKTE
ncbi:ABC transporter permease [Runella sp. CRIBMP]|uniref:ABC transporter permease n=1 Tax=Runella sp. CRIBMP TaxID=2683261 RepID=UPI001E3B9B2F|nr:ABC transporter permease [Runella sp. CRIBMP]